VDTFNHFNFYLHVYTYQLAYYHHDTYHLEHPNCVRARCHHLWDPHLDVDTFNNFNFYLHVYTYQLAYYHHNFYTNNDSHGYPYLHNYCNIYIYTHRDCDSYNEQLRAGLQLDGTAFVVRHSDVWGHGVR
jgi:hypothetical protein